MLTVADTERASWLDWFSRNRKLSRSWFEDLIQIPAYEARPIPLRNPIVFYEGHLAAFNVNTLVRRALGKPGVDASLEVLFERGIDPVKDSAVPGAPVRWPARSEVLRYVDAADRLVEHNLRTEDLVRDDVPSLRRGEAVHAMLEHEPMHRETLLYMFQWLPYEQKRPPAGYRPITDGAPPRSECVAIPPGRATLGAEPGEIPFGWDNEFPKKIVDVPAFAIDRHSVTNRDYLLFVEAGGYESAELWDPADFTWLKERGMAHPLFWARKAGRFFWRGLFEQVELPLAWPVYVSFAEASAYARWKGQRLPTEAEYHRAAFGAPDGVERQFPWGDDPPDATRGNFGLQYWDPVPAGSFPRGASAWGVHDLVGNGWEWTATPFSGFPGFEPMPSYPVYSADFFDGLHFVMKGASPATERDLIRRSFRNWFQRRYPYPYAKFRCVEP
jgi:ergothioneine biosynthesis protein EgtB